jgi:hypothetical protein
MTYAFTDDVQVEEFIDEEEGPGWDLYGWDDDQALEEYSLECAFGPEE